MHSAAEKTRTALELALKNRAGAILVFWGSWRPQRRCIYIHPLLLWAPVNVLLIACIMCFSNVIVCTFADKKSRPANVCSLSLTTATLFVLMYP